MNDDRGQHGDAPAEPSRDDGSFLIFIRPGLDIPRQLELLERLCDAKGRDFAAVETTCPWRFDVGKSGGGVDPLIEQLRGFAGMGIQTVFGRVVGEHNIEPIQIIGERVIPAIADA